MTRIHYRQFAAMLANMRSGLVIRDSEDVGFGKALCAIEDSLREILANDNPRFDTTCFRDAAQPRALEGASQ